MALTIGIIGLPQSGKTTLFNALTKAGAPISGYATRTVQANLAIVLRTFANSNVPHIYGDIDPNRDLDSLYAELALTDLATVERRIERTKKAAKSGEKKYVQELEVLHLLQEALNELRMINQVE